MLANINLASRQSTLGGKFYIDPWLQVSNAADADYRSDIVYFWQNILPNLNMTLYTSPVADPYSDSLFPMYTVIPLYGQQAQIKVHYRSLGRRIHQEYSSITWTPMEVSRSEIRPIIIGRRSQYKPVIVP